MIALDGFSPAPDRHDPTSGDKTMKDASVVECGLPLDVGHG